MENPLLIGERISLIIHKYNLTQVSFGKIVGLTSSSVSGLVAGKRTCKVDVLEKITEHFPEISPEWLLTGKGEMLKSEAEIRPMYTVHELAGMPKSELEKLISSVEKELKVYNTLLAANE